MAKRRCKVQLTLTPEAFDVIERIAAGLGCGRGAVCGTLVEYCVKDGDILLSALVWPIEKATRKRQEKWRKAVKAP